MLLRSCLSSWCIVFVVIFRLFCFSDKANRDYILKGNGCIDTLLSLFEVRPIHCPAQPTFRLHAFLNLCTILRQSQTLIYFFRTATMDKCVRTSFKHSSKSSENRVSTKEKLMFRHICAIFIWLERFGCVKLCRYEQACGHSRIARNHSRALRHLGGRREGTRRTRRPPHLHPPTPHKTRAQRFENASGISSCDHSSISRVIFFN